MADTDLPANDTSAADVIAGLEAAFDRVGDTEAAIDDFGEPVVEATADAYRRAHRLLDSYDESATGTGDFASYLKFQSAFIDLVDSLPADAIGADGFQQASDRMDKRRLSEADFAFARDAIEPAHEAVELLEAREDAYDDYRTARHAAKQRRRELEAEADRLSKLHTLGEADLSTPLEPLREPVEAYNEAVRTAFDRFRKQRSARDLFGLLEAAADRPLVDVDRPPRDLADYIETKPAGTEPLATLREYADYSPSKLDHYIDDPGALRTNVAVHQTYLDRLGPEPLLIAWPPAEPATLRARLRELAPIVRRLDSVFAADSDEDGSSLAADSADAAEPPDAGETIESNDTDETTEDTNGDEPAARIEIARRQLSRLTRTADYDRLRAVAVADAELTDEEFERLASGAVEDDIDAVEASLDALEQALSAYELD